MKQRRPQVQGLVSRPGGSVARRAARAVEGDTEGQYAPPLQVDRQGRLTLKGAVAIDDLDSKATLEQTIDYLNQLVRRLRAAGLIQT